MRWPPRRLNYANEPRRIGVEIEFAGIDARSAARLVQAAFGGHIRLQDAHWYAIEDTSLGTFQAELDSHHAHTYGKSETSRFEEKVREWIGDIASLMMPVEIVGPPIPLDALPSMDDLLARLRAAGAEGTDAGPLNAFGLQLNPEIPAHDAGYLLSVLRSYLLLSDWLRAMIVPDFTRRLFAFAEPFPRDYVIRVLDPGYAPDLADLIDDYVRANPTRNRELDLLPLFCWLDEERVRAHVRDALVKKRPTYHYRLPDARVGDATWSIVDEWNRWVRVEALADDPTGLREAAREYLALEHTGELARWPREVGRWLGP